MLLGFPKGEIYVSLEGVSQEEEGKDEIVLEYY